MSIFDTSPLSIAESSNTQCQYCRLPVSGTYYRVRSAISCPACTEKIREATSKKSVSGYPLALACGIGAAVLGMIVYAAFTILTGWIVSYVALLVGWMVGSAIKKGSKGAGGRRYQITAALLTYVAITTATLPIGVHFTQQRKQAQQRVQALRRGLPSFAPEKPLTPEQQQAKEQQLAAEQRQLEDEFGQPHAERVPLHRHSIPPTSAASSPPATSGSMPQPSGPSTQAATQPRPAPSVPSFLLGLLWLTLGSPFALFFVKGHMITAIINLAVLILGILFSWRITAGVNLVIFGPFEAPAEPTR